MYLFIYIEKTLNQFTGIILISIEMEEIHEPAWGCKKKEENSK